MKTKMMLHLMGRAVIAICASMLFASCANMYRYAGEKDPNAQEADVPPPAAKSGPSFDETRDWIITTMQQYGGTRYNGSIWHTYTDVEISNSGQLTYNDNEYHLSWHNGSTPLAIYRMTIPFGAITGIESAQPNTDIQIYTGGVAVITRVDTTGNNSGNNGSYGDWTLEMQNQPQAVAGQPIPISPQEMVKHFVPALQHMVEVCKDAYKAPTQTPQPF